MLRKPLLLLLDGHVSHQSVKTSALCDENGIQLYCLPPHSSHILQPLDVGVFKTMKCEWKKAVKKQNATEIVTKRTFAITFKDAYETTIARPLAEKAFRACGLYPLDPTNIDFSKVVSGFDDSVTAHPQPQLAIELSNTPTLLPAPVAQSTPQSPVTISSRPDTSDTPMRLVAPIAHSTPQSPLANRPGTPTPLPAPVAHLTPQSPVTISSRPDTSDTPVRLVAPIAHSIQQSPHVTACGSDRSRPTPTLVPAPITHSTPQSPLVCRTAAVAYVPNPARSTHPTARPSGMSSQDSDNNRPQTSNNADAFTQSTNTLRKFAMICSQIGDETLNLYYTRLEEGYDCDDPLFSLWSSITRS
ncbi:tigger transposable element-derived protein 6-like protein [Plakobranchus ocellatus]|uniref:Tigger transposable element-derived protein 6-like protein n=1 Tax=Plakobranchus ocellatus TaxID=259542 RepID=A0AAV3Z0T6_9GAST|nr:tigger transposable element-derived protein 6-like protein [Plakobranchus ocellatus]